MSNQPPNADTSTLTLGSIVRRRRTELGLSRPTVADQAGVSLNTVARLELGYTVATFDTLVRVTRVLGMSLDALAGELYEAA